MSDPIQSISQSNYILHNIDAKKLYVQEPLFTANSGDAVYVGWRPDETVLWSYSGTTAVTSGTLSEAASNFDMLRVCFREATVGDAAYQGGNLVGFIDIGECENGNNEHSGTCCFSFHNLLQNATIGLRYGLFYLTSPTTFTAYRGERPITAASSGTSIGNMWPTKIVGINRKENA